MRTLPQNLSNLDFFFDDTNIGLEFPRYLLSQITKCEENKEYTKRQVGGVGAGPRLEGDALEDGSVPHPHAEVPYVQEHRGRRRAAGAGERDGNRVAPPSAPVPSPREIPRLSHIPGPRL